MKDDFAINQTLFETEDFKIIVQRKVNVSKQREQLNKLKRKQEFESYFLKRFMRKN